MKKWIALILVCLTTAAFAGCSSNSGTPSASPSTGASAAPSASAAPEPLNTGGDSMDRYSSSSMEGPIEAISETELSIKVQGKTETFTMDEKAQKAVASFRKGGHTIEAGTVIIVKYSKDGDKLTANDIELVRSN